MPKQPVLYEAMYILDSALDEAASQQLIKTIEDIVTDNGGELVATREFGKRRLAFEINGHTNGTYMISYFKSFGNVVEELNREMQIIEGIVRGIVVVANPKAIFDPKAVAAPAPAEEAPAAEAPAEEAAVAEPAAEEPAVEAEEAPAATEEAPAATEEAEPTAEEAPAETVEETPAQEEA